MNPTTPVPAPDRLEILFEDAHILVAVKPAGLLTQGLTADDPADSMERRIRARLNAAQGGAGRAYLGTVHRLDRVVSGVMIWAKTERAARRLARDFEKRRVFKTYLAVVHGAPSEPEGVWEDWIGTSPDQPGRKVGGRESRNARFARTRFQRTAILTRPDSEARFAALVLTPETGWTHQLRVQASVRGMAIVGDARYDAPETFPQGILLHACELGVKHPETAEDLRFSAPIPHWWRDAGIDLSGAFERN